MSGLGVFGKIPGHGDFVAFGTGSGTGRAFERWCQMANDRAAADSDALPMGPIGFAFRGPTPESLLFGVIRASRDRVGRTFPLSVFIELELDAVGGHLGPAIAALADAFEQAATIAVAAEAQSKRELEAALRGAAEPFELPGLRGRVAEERARLDGHCVGQLFARAFPDTTDPPYYACGAILRAASYAARHASDQPVVLDVPMTSDVELMFWLTCVETAMDERRRPPAAFWDVGSGRGLIALGTPDSQLFSYLSRPLAGHRRLWPLRPRSPQVNAGACESLPGALVEVLKAADTCEVQAFLAELANATP